MDPCDWFKQVLKLNMAAIVSIVSKSDLRIELHCINQSNKIKQVLYKLLL